VKDVIIKGGRNIYPQEVEDIAGRVAGVRAGCVVAFGAPDERTGTDRLVVAAEIRSASESDRVSAEIARAIDEWLGMPPDVVELLPTQSIPKTSSGKLRRSETRRLYLERKLGKKVARPWMQFAGLAARSAAPRATDLFETWARNSLEFVYGIYALCAFTAVLIPLWLIVALTPDRARAAAITRSGARKMLLFAGVRFETSGQEILADAAKTGPWIFAPNHSSYLDVLVALSVLPPGVRFVAKSEVLEMPLVGRIAKMSGQFAFDRSDPQARIRNTEEVNQALRRGESVVIFPEGTFTETEGIRPFQLGAFKAALETERPICPLAMRGARQILRDRTLLPRPGKVRVTIGPLVMPRQSEGSDWREIVRLRDETRMIIARNTGEALL
jgi:1-acyl-sn-glycerol-3-phosphate acyltransferase